MAEGQPSRGRKRRRQNNSEPMMKDGELSSLSFARTRRSGNGQDKRFECVYDGCGKSYFRAEHLYRHQLNHSPKEIFRCDFPECTRSFVRQDLFARHKERHANKDEPQDSEILSSNRKLPSPQSMSNESQASSPMQPGFADLDISTSTGNRPVSTAHRQKLGNISLSEQHSRGMMVGESEPSNPKPRPSITNSILQVSSAQLSSLPSGPASSPTHLNWASPTRQSNVLASTGTHHKENTFSGLASSTPPRHSDRIGPATSGIPFTNPNFQNVHPIDKAPANSPASDLLSLDNIDMTYPMSTFDNQGSHPSPTTIRNDFTAWLFNEQPSASNSLFPIGTQLGISNYSTDFAGQAYPNYFADPALDSVYPNKAQQQFQATIDGFGDLSSSTALLSQGKRLELINLMEHRFNEVDHSAVRESKTDVFAGNWDATEHVLSMRSMQLYIGSYWYHFHAQMPILHKPTFSADDTHNYLLLAVMAIGASSLEDIHGRGFTDATAQLANFIAWHLRWQVFMDTEFQPPAKLWVFQTLLLLEVYEKMNANRALHERAHIHFATTLILMRRGSSLTGKPRSSSILPARVSDRSFMGAAADSTPGTPEEWWNQWITAEATRRAAFAAFFLDSTHATMFGHAAAMSVHEIRLPLPCDEALWSATSAAEVGRVETSLHANNIKQTTFIEGLKRTINGRKVRANSFGRMILMAGLLNVSWNMNQRELQGSSLGSHQALGVPAGWKDPLKRAFDFWKKDFDDSIVHMRGAVFGWQSSASGGVDDETIVEDLGTVLHHLSHMAMHIDLADCQILAGSTRLLGRTITHIDQVRVRNKITAWASSPGAREAVFHGISLLKSSLIPLDLNLEMEHGDDERLLGRLYRARDDPLFNRPWVLYFAALIVWSYGFALDGPLRPFPSHLASNLGSPDSPKQSNSGATLAPPRMGNIRAMVRDAKSFLDGPMGIAKHPEELERVKTGRNKVVGLLGVVCRAFEDSRWELLHEADERLRSAVSMLHGEQRGSR